MSKHREFLLKRVDPLLYHLLSPRRIVGVIMLLMALATIDRPLSLLATHVGNVTQGAITAYGAAALLAYSLLAWSLSQNNPNVGLIVSVLAISPVLFSLSFALTLSRRESAADEC